MANALKGLLIEHDVIHVEDLKWKGKKDLALLADANRQGFDAILTNDRGQFNDPDECDAIRRSRLHHISYTIRDGMDGLALAVASVSAAMRPIMRELSALPNQHVVKITAISPNGKRYELTNPMHQPPSKYWR